MDCWMGENLSTRDTDLLMGVSQGSRVCSLTVHL